MCNRKIQWPTILVWWQKKGYCSDMPNVVSSIDGTSHEIQIPLNNVLKKEQLLRLTNSYLTIKLNYLYDHKIMFQC